MNDVTRADPQLLRPMVGQTMLRDRHRLAMRLERLSRRPREEVAAQLESLAGEIERSAQRRAAREALRPANISYPPDLPVSQRKDDIARAIRDNQVVVLCGDTGSGKTTQLPKICLEIGRGAGGLIGHTQPRRIAARSVAARIAEELGTSLGSVVGYKVRFGDKTGENTLVKLMTDGILLAETQGDRLLEAYDTLIVDEAHERSLNIDFLLGYLKKILPQRLDLKVIITSATIDPQRFSAHFGDCPIILVEGRTYPVEVRYRPLEGDELEPVETLDDGDDRGDGGEARGAARQGGWRQGDQRRGGDGRGGDERRGDGRGAALVATDPVEAVISAVRECFDSGPGDILAFFASEREIRETADALGKALPGDLEILPLFARLAVEEQQRVFQPRGRRRVVLATNVAETSLTVPNIRYVIDPGTARISRYNPRSKVQRLPIEPVSRASADQRKGRCGRVGPGVCIRLYSQEDFETRQQFTEPEIRRTNLASVILQMSALRLGDVAAFPFIDPPEARLIRDGYNTLRELGAVSEDNTLTPLGHELARIPTDPRIGRMILAAEHEDVLDEVLVIAAALSVADPRDRPMDQQQQADTKHEAFRDPRSDFLGYLKMWEAFAAKSRELGSSGLRKWCREHFLSYTRMREWQEVHRQLRMVVAEQLSARR